MADLPSFDLGPASAPGPVATADSGPSFDLPPRKIGAAYDPSTKAGEAGLPPVSFTDTDPGTPKGLVIDVRPHSLASDTGSPDTGQLPLDRSGSGDPYGLAKNVATGLLRMPTHVPGMLGEARDTGELIGSNIASLAPGETRTAKEIRDDFKRNNALEFDTMMSVHGPTSAPMQIAGTVGKAFMDAPTGGDLYQQYIEPTVGAYEPESMAGRALQAGLESALPIPGGKAEAGANILRRAVTSAPVVGAGMGAISQAVTEATGSPGLGIGASFLVPRAAKVVRPSFSAETQAGQKLWQATGNEGDQTLNNLRQIAGVGYRGEAGSPLTLSEAGGSSNLAQVEKGHGTQNTQFGTDLRSLEGQQAEQRRGAIGAMAPGADPTSVSGWAQKIHDTIFQGADQATQHQQGIVDAMHPPGSVSPEVAGKNAFDIADANNKTAREAVSQAYHAIDPNNAIPVNAMPLSAAATEIQQGINPRVHLPAPEAEAVVKMATKLPPTMMFNDLVEFDKTVGQALWRARKDGKGVDLLTKLQDAVHEARDGALDQREAWEKGAVQRGEIKSDQTVSARVQQQLANTNNARARRAGNQVGDGGVNAGPTNERSPGTGELPGAGPPHFARGQGIPGIPLNQDELAAAAQRQAAAKAAHSGRKKTYEEGPVGSVLTAKKPLMGNVPGSAFSAGPSGAEKTRSWIKAGAGNPEMLEAIKDMAVTELSATLKNGVVTPKELAAWKKKFGSALSEIDKHDSGFSQRFDQHAIEQQHLVDIGDRVTSAKNKFNKSELAKFMGDASAEEVSARVSGMLPSGKNANLGGLTRLRKLVAQLQDNPRALEGLRGSVADWLKKQASSSTLVPGTGGIPVQGAAPGQYLRVMQSAQPHLEAVFGAGGYEAAEQVAQEMTRSKQIIDAKITKGGSDSAKNLIQFLDEATSNARAGHGMNIIEGGMLWEAARELLSEGLGILHGDVVPLAKAAALFAAQQGVHQWKAGVAGKRGAAATVQANIIRDALLDPEYGHKLLERGRDMRNVVPQGLIDKMQQAHAMGVATDRSERSGHAAGGAVKTDHARHAAVMVRHVAKIRDELGRATKPLLNVNDSAIASALETARKVAA